MELTGSIDRPEQMSPAIALRATLLGLAALGQDDRALLAAAGLVPRDLEDPFGAVPLSAFGRVWSSAFRAMPDPTLPTRAAFAVPFGAFGLVDYLAAGASTVGEGMELLALYFRLVAGELGLRIDRAAGDWVWTHPAPTMPCNPIAEHWTMAIIYNRFRQCNPAFAAAEAVLPVDGSGVAAACAALWGVPVRPGGRSQAGLRLLPGIWDTPNDRADPGLQQTLLTLADRAEISRFRDGPLGYVVRGRLPSALRDGRFTADQMAASLGLSRRSLHRRLAAEQTTYEQLLDGYRREEAVRLLQAGHDLAEIALALGYSEQSAFSRAFRRWMGRPPLAYRRAVAPDGP